MSAVALGIAAGVLLRRVLPAIATALGGFIALRVLVGLFLRQDFMAPITRILPINVSRVTGRTAQVWWLASYITSPSGRSSETGIRVPVACQTLFGSKQFQPCLTAHGYHRILTYQPADRFWTFQAIEAGIFALLAAVLLLAAYWRVTTADA